MKVRIRFAKTGKVRWTSHRDVARMWERALRRVRLPLAYTEGFSPRPRVSFGLALPTGHESVAEYLDVEVAEGGSGDMAGPEGTPSLEMAGLPGVLSEALPDGVDVLGAAVLEGRVPSLQHDVTSCSWEVEIVGVAPARMAALVEEALGAPQLLVTRERKGRQVTDDLRPAIISLGLLESRQAGTVLGTELADFVRAKPTFGTCAGAILLAKEVTGPTQRSLGALDIQVRRNAYGRQVESSIRQGELNGAPLEMVFIRAPKIEKVGRGVEVLAREGNDPVLVRQGKTMAATFHPELSDDTRVHGEFLKMLNGAK